MKHLAFALATVGALLSTQSMAQVQPAVMKAAFSDPARPEADTRQDASRHPAELVAFSKVKAGDTVVDVVPGGGYWSRLFSTAVGPKGKVYAYVPGEFAGFKSDPVATAKAIASEPGRGNVEQITLPLAQQWPASINSTVDIVWTFENYHDFHDSFMKGADVGAFNQAVFSVLKPGGYFIIGDHAAAAGSKLKNTEDLHRIDPEEVKAEVEKAGFIFDGEIKALANPDDDHALKVFDPAIRGKTDRFVFRFRKPAQ
ncbi:methyltransferase [Paucibacter sp. R3-3]|uniref:Methyltransferase n=1 Tax=Roseateles agri TaxID=3098619 RepID=A0ABU5DHI2_9BURK|nr:methyltransferase [Paucibacter sp. R3-3]MDY0745745.1 methyltransferase [Paucibacter sp. R3-3]